MHKKTGKIITLSSKAEALLLHPPRRVNGVDIPAVPKGAGVYAKWGLQLTDPRGKIVPIMDPKTKKLVEKLEGPSHSFTRQFGFFIRGILLNEDGGSLNVNETLTDDAGASFLMRGKAAMTNALGISGLAKMKFGDSAAAVDTTDIDIQGVQLGSEATAVVALTIEDSTNTIFTVVGQVTNSTGGLFTVEEMAAFPELGDTAGVTNNTTMMLRDLTGPVAVADTLTITGTYTITIAV